MFKRFHFSIRNDIVFNLTYENENSVLCTMMNDMIIFDNCAQCVQKCDINISTKQIQWVPFFDTELSTI